MLHLTLKKKWFDMILSGEKKEEYREIKPYWTSRLKLDFRVICFRNGYNPLSPFFCIEFTGLRIGRGKPEWGAPGYDVYILSLGKII